MMSLFDAQSRARPAARLAAWARQCKKRVAGPMRIVDESLVEPGDGARRENKLNNRVCSTESTMTQILHTKEETQFNHYSGADEVSSVAFVDDDKWRIIFDIAID